MIHRLRIRNFKSLIDVAVDLSPVTVLVGKSGTGKSNFVESLRFLRDVLSSDQNRQVAQQQWSQFVPATEPEASMHFEVEFLIAGIEEPFTYALGLSSQGPVQAPVEERLALGRRCLFHQKLSDERHPHSSTWVVEPELLQIPKPGAIALGRIPSISEVVIAFTALTSGIGCYVFPDTVLCAGGQTQPMGGGQIQRTIGVGRAKRDSCSHAVRD